MEEASKQGESEMEEGEKQEDEEVSQQSQAEQEHGSQLTDGQSSSQDDGGDNEANLKAWKSLLIRDGVGPFLNPRRLVEKVQYAMVKHGLIDLPKYYAEALGQLMDSTEFYMRDIITKVIKRARVRMQESHPNMSLARAGDQNNFNTVSYQLNQIKSLQIVNRSALNLVCTDNVTKELNYLVAKDYEHAKIVQQAAEAKTTSTAVIASDLEVQ